MPAPRLPLSLPALPLGWMPLLQTVEVQELTRELARGWQGWRQQGLHSGGRLPMAPVCWRHPCVAGMPLCLLVACPACS